MQARIDPMKIAPEAYKAMSALERYIHASGLEPGLVHMVKLRASQLNGCAFCIDMHWKDARAAGESEQRLYGLDAWRESPYYTDRERAAFEWTEAVTFLHEGHVSDEVYERVHRLIDDKTLVDLTMAIAAINAWNRLAISLRTVPGGYQPPSRERRTD